MLKLKFSRAGSLIFGNFFLKAIVSFLATYFSGNTF